MGKKIQKMRSWIAHMAKNMGGAGPMKDKRTPRGGTRNSSRDYLSEYEEEQEDTLTAEEEFFGGDGVSLCDDGTYQEFLAKASKEIKIAANRPKPPNLQKEEVPGEEHYLLRPEKEEEAEGRLSTPSAEGAAPTISDEEEEIPEDYLEWLERNKK